MDFICDLIFWISLYLSTPTEEKKDTNLKILRKQPWFQPVYAKYMNEFMNDWQVRDVLGTTNIKKILTNERARMRFIRRIEIVSTRNKKHKIK